MYSLEDDGYPGKYCLLGTSDGLGTVLTGYNNNDFLTSNTYDAQTLNGTPLTNVNTALAYQSDGPLSPGSPMYPEESGFEAFATECNYTGFGCAPHSYFDAWSHLGQPTAHVEVYPYLTTSAPDPSGGMLLVGYNPNTAHVLAQRFTSGGVGRSGPIAVAPVAGVTAVVGGVNLAGHSLVLWTTTAGGNRIMGRWFDPYGKPLTAEFALPSKDPLQGAELIPLLDGSLALRALSTQGQQSWVARFPSASPYPGSVPSWLATRPTASVFIVRGGRAYALTFPNLGGAGTCTLQVALFAPSGLRCGGFDLPADAACGTAIGSSVGRDGTVVALTDEYSNAVGIICVERWWPRLLQ
jgi:hypothetical protein